MCAIWIPTVTIDSVFVSKTNTASRILRRTTVPTAISSSWNRLLVKGSSNLALLSIRITRITSRKISIWIVHLTMVTLTLPASSARYPDWIWSCFFRLNQYLNLIRIGDRCSIRREKSKCSALLVRLRLSQTNRQVLLQRHADRNGRTLRFFLFAQWPVDALRQSNAGSWRWNLWSNSNQRTRRG